MANSVERMEEDSCLWVSTFEKINVQKREKERERKEKRNNLFALAIK